MKKIVLVLALSSISLLHAEVISGEAYVMQDGSCHVQKKSSATLKLTCDAFNEQVPGQGSILRVVYLPSTQYAGAPVCTYSQNSYEIIGGQFKLIPIAYAGTSDTTLTINYPTSAKVPMGPVAFICHFAGPF